MKKMKRRLALLLCMMLAVPAALGCLPAASLHAEAAEVITLRMNPSGGGIEAEAGKTIPLSKLTYYVNEKYVTVYLSAVKGVEYESSDTAVATVDKQGKVKTKKAGTAKITITYRGATAVYTIKVVKKGAHNAKSAKYTRILKLAKEIDRYKNKKITASNRYKVSQLHSLFYEASDKVVDHRGFADDKYYPNYTYVPMILPELLDLEVGMASTRVYEYAKKNNPVGTVSGKCFKVRSVSAKANSNTFTIRLTKKVNATQIFAIKEYYNWEYNTWTQTHKGESFLENDKTARFPIYLIDQKTGYRYRGWAVATEKSAQLTVTMDYFSLKAKRSYQIKGDITGGGVGAYKNGWAKGKTFTVK